MDIAGQIRLPHPVSRLSGHEIRQALGGDLPRVTPEGLLAVWHWTTISILIEGNFVRLEGNDIARKIRGALWPVLKSRASPEALRGEPCPRRPACALDLLWNAHGMLNRAREIPKPWILRSVVGTPVRSGIQKARVDLVLFGFAGAWAMEISDAVREAIDGRRTFRGRSRSAWRFLDAQIVDDLGLPVPSTRPRELILQFLSPLRLTRDGEPAGNYRGLLASAIDRIRGLALWHGVSLECDFAQLREIARASQVDDINMNVSFWKRVSKHLSQDNERVKIDKRVVPVVDLRGEIRLPDVHPDLLPFIFLSSTCGLGKDARHGLGWFHLLVPREDLAAGTGLENGL
jgi:hypothetical protein